MRSERDVLNKFLKDNNLKVTRQRDVILDEFLKTEKHISAEELYKIVRKKDKGVGQATVFRAVKTFVDAGLAEPVAFTEKTIKYEHKYNHNHHDHLICHDCGAIVEFSDDRIEKLQESICKNNGFMIRSHRLEIFGECGECRKKSK